MGSYEPGSETSPAPLEPLPRLEAIPAAAHGAGLDPASVAEAFEVFHRQLGWYRAQASALPALIETGRQEARTDALKLIRAAAEFADVLERDAQEVAARQISRVESEIHRREGDLRDRESLLAIEKEDLDRRRSEVLAAARREADEIVAAAHRSGAEARHEAELAKLRVLEEARRQIAELTNATRAEVEHTLEWSRAQAEGIVRRARSVAEQLLTASMRGDEHVAEVVNAIVRSAESQVGPVPAALASPRAELPTARPAPPVASEESSAEPSPLPREPSPPGPYSPPAAPGGTDPGQARDPGGPNGFLAGLPPAPEPVRFSWLPGGDRPAA